MQVPAAVPVPLTMHWLLGAGWQRRLVQSAVHSAWYWATAWLKSSIALWLPPTVTGQHGSDAVVSHWEGSWGLHAFAVSSNAS
jgi:hypothetical protein